MRSPLHPHEICFREVWSLDPGGLVKWDTFSTRRWRLWRSLQAFSLARLGWKHWHFLSLGIWSLGFGGWDLVSSNEYPNIDDYYKIILRSNCRFYWQWYLECWRRLIDEQWRLWGWSWWWWVWPMEKGACYSNSKSVRRFSPIVGWSVELLYFENQWEFQDGNQ